MIALLVLGSFKQTNQKKKKKHLFILLNFKLPERDKMKIINLMTLSLKPDLIIHPFHSIYLNNCPTHYSEVNLRHISLKNTSMHL